MESLEQQACTQGWKKAYTVNQIVRMGALNCFEKLKSVNQHFNVVIT